MTDIYQPKDDLDRNIESRYEGGHEIIIYHGEVFVESVTVRHEDGIPLIRVTCPKTDWPPIVFWHTISVLWITVWGASRTGPATDIRVTGLRMGSYHIETLENGFSVEIEE